MNVQKTLLASAIAVMFGLGSATVLAQGLGSNNGEGEFGDQTSNVSDSGNDNSSHSQVTDSHNDGSDNSIAESYNDGSDRSTTVSDSNNDNSDRSTTVSDSDNDNSDRSVSDSNNDNSDRSHTVADSHNDSSDNSVSDSNNDNSDRSHTVADSHNDSSSISESFNSAVEMNAVQSETVLAGEVTGNRVHVGREAHYDSSNYIGSDSFVSPSGITQASQVSGSNNLTQQQVSVQAHMSLGSGD